MLDGQESGQVEIVPAEEFNKVLDSAFTKRLVPLGFERIKANRWVHSGHAPIRRVFALSGLKGLSTAPVWGFSFDFVPHLAGGDEVKWHRTAKSAWLDLPYDPIDYTHDMKSWSLSRFEPAGALEKAADGLAGKSTEAAVAFWARIGSLEDVPRVFEEWQSRPFVRFGFINYVHASLVYAFVLARLGRPSDATAWLERYLAHDIRDEAKALLRTRLNEAQLNAV